MNKKYTDEQIKGAIAYWTSMLKESSGEKNAAEMLADYLADNESSDETTEVKKDKVNEVEVVSKKYPPNTVGSLITVLKTYCQMEDVLLPRVNKQEHFITDVYSKAGRCVIDIVKGTPVDTSTL